VTEFLYKEEKAINFRPILCTEQWGCDLVVCHLNRSNTVAMTRSRRGCLWSIWTLCFKNV